MYVDGLAAPLHASTRCPTHAPGARRPRRDRAALLRAGRRRRRGGCSPQFAAAGVDVDAYAAELQQEGAEKFVDSWTSLLGSDRREARGRRGRALSADGARDGPGRSTQLSVWAAAARPRARSSRAGTLAGPLRADPGRGRRADVRGRGPAARRSHAARHAADARAARRSSRARPGSRSASRAMFAGEHINVSEDRAALHVALRAPRGARSRPAARTSSRRCTRCSTGWRPSPSACAPATWTGATGERDPHGRERRHRRLRTSGPRWRRSRSTRTTPDEPRRCASSPTSTAATSWRVTRGLDPAETLVIVASKTFTTLETMTNAHTLRDWITGRARRGRRRAAHGRALDERRGASPTFGIDPANMFGFWDWVGGRYSMDSAIGLSTMIAIGPEALRRAARRLPRDRRAPARRRRSSANLPVLLGLLSVWNRNVLGLPDRRGPAVRAGARALPRLPPAARDGEQRQARDARRDAGALGDLAGALGRARDERAAQLPPAAAPGDRDRARASCIALHAAAPRRSARTTTCCWRTCSGRPRRSRSAARAEELRALGSPEDADPAPRLRGRPPEQRRCSSTARSRRARVGRLVALYEHRVLTEGVLWGIDSFDQWGVELGKVLAGAIAGRAHRAPSRRSSRTTRRRTRSSPAARARGRPLSAPSRRSGASSGCARRPSPRRRRPSRSRRRASSID